MIQRTLSAFVKQLEVDCEKTVVVKIDRCVFNLDKDVLLIACCVARENSLLYDTVELNDGMHILEENILQAVQNLSLIHI